MGCSRRKLLVLRRCRIVTSLLTVALGASLTTVVLAGQAMVRLLLVRRGLLVSTAAIIVVLPITTLLLIASLLPVSAALVVAGARAVVATVA